MNDSPPACSASTSASREPNTHRGEHHHSKPTTSSFNHSIPITTQAEAPYIGVVPSVVAKPPPAWSLVTNTRQRAKIFPFWMIKPPLTASYMGSTRCAPLPASFPTPFTPTPLSLLHRSSPCTHTAPLFLGMQEFHFILRTRGQIRAEPPRR